MAYIIAEPCIGVKDTACVKVCPVDCIYEFGNGNATREPGDGIEPDSMLYIHPDECIDCGACEPECPVEAIFEEESVPEKWKNFIEINAKVFDE